MSVENQEIELKVKRKTVRFTIDFDVEQHRFLKLYSLESGLQSAHVIRALVYLLEINESVANAVIDKIFGIDIETGFTVTDQSNNEVEVKVKRKTVRFTIDFDFEQHRFLKLFSLESGVQAALVVRALVDLLEINEEMSNAVFDEIFGELQ